MSQDQVLRQLLIELMEEYDPDIDTADGSTFDTGVMTPFLERIGGSPLDVDFESFAVERLETEIEDIDVSQFSGIRELLVRGAVVILDPVRREIRSVKLSQSLNNYEQLTRDEVNVLLGNLFLSLREGDKSTGTVRVYFLSPQSVVVTPLQQFSTGSGLNFFPTTVQSISQTAMSFNYDGSLYYFDVTVESEESGEAYNVDIGDINGVTGISGAVRVSNLVAFDDSVAEETKEEGIVRAQESITVRNLSVERGISVVLSEEFSFINTVQAVGAGDEEMQRDVIVGPVAISDVPGGFASVDLPSLGSGQEVHIGGKTDVYVYQKSLVEKTLDFENLADRGVLVYRGAHGYTTAVGIDTINFKDDYGHFLTRGIQIGDLLYVGEYERTVVDVSTDQLTVDTVLPTGLFELPYEVTRPFSGQISVPLHNRIAVENGEEVFDVDGDPVQPKPGSLTNEPLLDSGSVYVKQDENFANENMSLPVVQVSAVEFLDPITLEASGVEIPMRDILLAKNLSAFSGGGVGTYATGAIRLYFRDAVSSYALIHTFGSDKTLFTYQTLSFHVVAFNGDGTARVDGAGNTLVLEGTDYTSNVGPGNRVYFLGQVVVIQDEGTYSAPDTSYTVREIFSGAIGSTAFKAYEGNLEADMAQDMETGLYYVDIPVQATTTGTASNLVAETEFAVTNMQVEGWTFKPMNSVLSYSTRELPYIQFSRWVNDTTDLEDSGTAYALRVTYDHASKLGDVQDYVDDPQYRITADDILVKHFQPAYVRGTFPVRGLTQSVAETAIYDFINDLDPTADLEVSDVVSELYDVGATKVTLPVSLVVLVQDAERSWKAIITEDSLTSNRVQHFLADQNFLTVSVLS